MMVFNNIKNTAFYKGRNSIVNKPIISAADVSIVR